MYQSLINSNSLHIPLADNSVHTVVTSPPYWGLRDYGTAKWVGGDPNCDHIQKNQKHGGEAARPYQDEVIFQYKDICPKCGAVRVDKQLGLEPTPEEYVANMVQVFRGVWRVLRDDGVVFLNLGDSYYSNEQREQSCGNFGITKPDCQGRDYLLKSLYDVRKDADCFRNSDIPHYHAPKQVRELCLKTLGYMGELIDHFPSVDSFYQKQNVQFLASILDRLRFQDLAGVRLLSFLESTPDVSFQQPQDRYRLLGSLWVFLLRLRSLIDDAQEYVHKLGDYQDPTADSLDNIYAVFLLAFHNGYKYTVYACYSVFESYQHYTTPSQLKPKDLVGIPWRVAFALQADGWYLRSDIIWSKPNPMPESVRDRPTKSHEYVFLLSKSARYYWDQDAVREDSIDPESFIPKRARHTPTMMTHDPKHCKFSINDDGILTNTGKVYPKRNIRSVWNIATQPYSGAHFATFPQKLVEPCIKAGTSEHGVCPICGAPWERVMERTGYHFPDDDKTSKQINAGVRISEKKSGSDYKKFKEKNPDKFIGFRSTCEHDAEPIPATVLDPFGGSGTTLLVARQLGRNAIGLDLSFSYLQLARERLGYKQLDDWNNGSAVQVEDNLPLFQERYVYE